jgi:hypothetical protein
MTFTTTVRGKVSTNNSGSGSGNFSSGGNDDVSTFSTITIYALAANGGTLTAEFSNNGTNFDISESLDLPDNVAVTNQLTVKGQFFRLNQSGGSGTFRVQTLLHPSAIRIPVGRSSIDHFGMSATNITGATINKNNFSTQEAAAVNGPQNFIIENNSSRVMTVLHIRFAFAQNDAFTMRCHVFKNPTISITGGVFSSSTHSGGVRFLTSATNINIDGSSADLVYNKFLADGSTRTNLALFSNKIKLNPGEQLFGVSDQNVTETVLLEIDYSLE